MELVVLGSGTVSPSPHRTAPAHWLSVGPVKLLLDCGAGALHRAAGFGVPWSEVTHVAVSHFHIDHWGELPLLLFALRWGIEPSRAERLRLIGPVGLSARMTMLAAAFGEWVLAPGYPLEVREVAAGEAYELGPGITLESCKTPHTDQSLAFAVRAGETRFVYTGDTGPSDELGRWASDCDLLLSECSLPDHRSVEIHLTPSGAGDLAQRARARRLVLTHFYPPVEDTDPAEMAARVFDGEVVAARDGDRFTVES